MDNSVWREAEMLARVCGANRWALTGLFTATLALLGTACIEKNPIYCDDDNPCSDPGAVCNLEIHTCEPKSQTDSGAHSPDDAGVDSQGEGAWQSMLSVAPSKFDFGLIRSGAITDPQIFIVRNEGQVHSGPIAAALEGDLEDSFVITRDDCSASLPPGGTCSVQVAFGPTGVGVQRAQVVLTVSPDGSVAVALAGTGTSTALSGLVVGSRGPVVLQPGFDAATLSYTAQASHLAQSVTVTPTALDPGASITVDGIAVESGSALRAIAVGAEAESIVVKVRAQSGETRDYEVTVDPSGAVLQQAFLKGSDGTAGDQMGTSVAIHGDRLVAGAPYKDYVTDSLTKQEAGRVYAFRYASGAWREEPTVGLRSYLDTAGSLFGSNERLGISVGLATDLMVAGAPWSGSAIGAVYAYRYASGSWKNPESLSWVGAAGERYRRGSSLAVSDDLMVVGVPSDGYRRVNSNILYQGTGAAYVFRRRSNTWVEEAQLKAGSASDGDSFGQAVALDGDVVVVGAPGEDGAFGAAPTDNSLSSSGAVYVFRRKGETWAQEQRIKVPEAHENDRFGESVALHGDLLVVGMPDEAAAPGGAADDESMPMSGSAYLFRHSSGQWQQEALLRASNAGEYDEFGASVSVDGDVVAVGAPDEDSAAGADPADNSVGANGAVYLFRNTAKGWQQVSVVKAEDTAGWFGRSVALDAQRLVVGAPIESSSPEAGPDDTSAPACGAVYVFH